MNIFSIKPQTGRLLAIGLALGLIGVAVAVLVRIWLLPSLGTRLVYITFYPVVLLCGVYGGVYAGVFATALSSLVVLLWKPGGQSFINDHADWLGFWFYILVCILITLVCSALHRSYKLRQRAQLDADEALRNQHKSAERFRKAIENSPIGIALTSPSGQFMEVNPALLAILGYSEEELRNLCAEDITHPDDLENERKFLSALLGESNDVIPQIEKRFVGKNGEVIWVFVTGSVLRDDNGTPIQIIKQVQNISDRKELVAKLQYQAQYDFLTGLVNRRYFLERAEQEFLRSGRYDHNISVAMLDIDHFKTINDSYGHQVGDELLKKFAATCIATLREVDLIGRMGGDEFAIMLPETSIEEAFEVLERLRSSLADIHLDGTKGQSFKITTSIGVATYGTSDITLSLLLNRADEALYDAKASGRNKTNISIMH